MLPNSFMIWQEYFAFLKSISNYWCVCFLPTEQSLSEYCFFKPFLKNRRVKFDIDHYFLKYSDWTTRYQQSKWLELPVFFIVMLTFSCWFVLNICLWLHPLAWCRLIGLLSAWAQNQVKCLSNKVASDVYFNWMTGHDIYQDISVLKRAPVHCVKQMTDSGFVPMFKTFRDVSIYVYMEKLLLN